MVEYRASLLNFSEPTKLLDALMRDGRLVHDGSPVARWCVSNVVGHYDARGNVYPRKAPREVKDRLRDCHDHGARREHLRRSTQ